MTISLKANLDGVSGAIQVDGVDVLSLESNGSSSQLWTNSLPIYGSELATVTSNIITLSAPTDFTQNISVISGQAYKISWIQTNSVVDNGAITVSIGTVNSGLHIYRTITSASAMEIILTANTTGTVALKFAATVYTASGTISIASVSCKQVISTVVPISLDKDETGTIRNERRITYGGTNSPSVSLGLNALVLNTQNGTTSANMQSSGPSGVSNTAIGAGALKYNTTGYNNTANGVLALYSNTTGYNNTANGMSALQYNTTGYQNTANGVAALQFNTTTGGTTYTSVTVTNGVSSNSFGLNDTNRRILVQAQSTNGGFVSGTWYAFVWNGIAAVWEGGSISGTVTFISSGSSLWSNISGFGYNAQVSGSNQVQLGDSATTTYVYGTVQNRSDLRDKIDIRDTILGLDFVKSLRPVDFKWDLREDYIEQIQESVLDEDGNPVLNEHGQPVVITKTINHDKDGSKKRNRYHHGLIAQELKQTLDDKGIDFGGFQDHTIAGGLDRLTIGYDELIAPLIKAIQEQQLIIEQLTSRIEALEV